MNILNSIRHIRNHIHIKNTSTTSVCRAAEKFDLKVTKHGNRFLCTSAPQTKRSTVIFAHLRSNWKKYLFATTAIGVVSTTTYLSLADTKLRRNVHYQFLPKSIDTLSHAKDGYSTRLASSSLAYLAKKYESAIIMVNKGALEAFTISLKRSRDIKTVANISEALLNLAAHEEISSEILSSGVIRQLCVVALNVSDPQILQQIAKTVTRLASRDRLSEEVLQQAQIPALRHLLSTQDADFAKTIARSIATTSKKGLRTMSQFEMAQGQILDLLRVLNSMPNIGIKIAITRTIANIALDDNLDPAIGEQSLEILSNIRLLCQFKSNEINEQVVRALANISVGEGFKPLVGRREWIDYLFYCTNVENNTRLRLSALVALGNITTSERISGKLQNNDSLFLLIKQFRTQPKNTTQNASSKGSASDILRLIEEDDDVADHDIISRNTLSTFTDPKFEVQVARICSNVFKNASISKRVVSQDSELWQTVVMLNKSQTLETKRYMMRAIANLAVNEPKALKDKSELKTILREGLLSKDPTVRSEAIRTQATLADVQLKGPKYAEGIYLLYPDPSQLERKNFEPDVDFVFIHGITGHPISTWRGSEENSNVSWPRDWLPKDLPNSRVLSVGYDIFLSHWTGTALPIPEQARAVLEKLKLAAVGNKRPVVFVCHSFGGLVIKQLLLFAHNEPQYKNILDNTVAVVFYSTPHLGSKLTYYDKGYLDVFFRGTAAMVELSPENNRLKELNEAFPKIAPHVSTMSFGETITCFGAPITHTVTCYQIVDEDSANPKFLGENHKFFMLDQNHRNVCKPASPEDERYARVINFVKEELEKAKSRPKK